jgi:hypothetical protein
MNGRIREAASAALLVGIVTFALPGPIAPAAGSALALLLGGGERAATERSLRPETVQGQLACGSEGSPCGALAPQPCCLGYFCQYDARLLYGRCTAYGLSQ